MTHAEAVAILERMVSANADPALSMGDIDALLAMHRLRDRHDIKPTEAGWEPTWDLNAAAAEGWRWKAAAIADRFSFSADGSTYNRDQHWQHCMDMARFYSARIIRTLDPAPYKDELDTLGLIP